MDERYDSRRCDQSTMTDHAYHQTQWVTVLKDWLQIISSILIPLMLGVFTVTITFQQQNMARLQRIEDLKLSREQREQDLNISRLQRLEDQESAREQRMLDQETAQLQRAEDARRRELDLNTSLFRRDVDLDIAEAKRKHDDLLAAQQRNLSDSQKNHELNIEGRRYEQEMDKHRDGLLVTYMTEIGHVLKANNGSCAGDFVVRGKTLALLRQLDPSRKTHLLRFLYEAGQLTNQYGPPMNLYFADFDDIDISGLNLPGIHLAGASMKNISAVGGDLSFANFTEINGTGSDFTSSKLFGAQFNFAILDNVTFASANGTRTEFSHTNAIGSNFVNAEMNRASFEYSNLIESNFSEANVALTNFAFTILNRSDFINAICSRTNFTYAFGVRINFKQALLSFALFINATISNGQFPIVSAVEANFANSYLYKANFGHARLFTCNFAFSYLSYGQFPHAQLNRPIFTQSTLTDSNFAFATVVNGNFSQVNIARASFNSAKVDLGNFTMSNARYVNFTNASLIQINFQRANLEYAIFSGAYIDGIYLMNAHLLKAKISDSQLQQARSISGCLLPNNTIGEDRNLIVNGHVDCNTNLSDKTWKVLKGDIAIVSVGSGIDCRFQSSNNDGNHSIITQLMQPSKSLSCFETSFAILRARFGGPTLVSLIIKTRSHENDETAKIWQNATLRSSNKSIRVPIDPSISGFDLLLRIEFFGSSINSSTVAWCDDIHLTLEITNVICMG